MLLKELCCIQRANPTQTWTRKFIMMVLDLTLADLSWQGPASHEFISCRPYLLKCKVRFFPKIWCLNIWGVLKFMYEVNWITLNQTMHSQTKACITKLSCVNKRKNRHDTLLLLLLLLLSPPSSPPPPLPLLLLFFFFSSFSHFSSSCSSSSSSPPPPSSLGLLTFTSIIAASYLEDAIFGLHVWCDVQLWAVCEKTLGITGIVQGSYCCHRWWWWWWCAFDEREGGGGREGIGGGGKAGELKQQWTINSHL